MPRRIDATGLWIARAVFAKAHAGSFILRRYIAHLYIHDAALPLYREPRHRRSAPSLC